ncbi:DNA starvation/stationary phase protection protein [Aliikangiella marina]|uniref:DNA starvation/stationary phase protection protein n=1 Tax=Aliikangiella marina TaxID=1712262 RepID=A0A545TJK4_9GAMM|nr:DNA starvation/stationary phase protection protein [Aliikangiella marina]TQV77402.1 DNA starvation/stationary phase protection protein [Aliikangiella marina]
MTITNTVFNQPIDESAVDNGVMRYDRKLLSKLLTKALADTYSLHDKTRIVNWNITGPLFYSVHTLTKAQYQELFIAIDALAERVRAIGFLGPRNVTQLHNQSRLSDIGGDMKALEMIWSLVNANEICCRSLRAAAQEAIRLNDVVTADFLSRRVEVHEKNAWMLRSLIE